MSSPMPMPRTMSSLSPTSPCLEAFLHFTQGKLIPFPTSSLLQCLPSWKSTTSIITLSAFLQTAMQRILYLHCRRLPAPSSPTPLGGCSVETLLLPSTRLRASYHPRLRSSSLMEKQSDTHSRPFLTLQLCHTETGQGWIN